MNLIESIARGVLAGLSHAAIAAKLEAEHGLQVGESWVAKITGADAFSAVLAAKQAELTALETEVKADVAAVSSKAAAPFIALEDAIKAVPKHGLSPVAPAAAPVPLPPGTTGE